MKKMMKIMKNGSSEWWRKKTEMYDVNVPSQKIYRN